MYGIWKVGSKTDRIGCEMEFTEYGWLNCGAGDGFQMNSDTLRYMFFFNGTYMTATIDTSKSEIGDTIVLKEDRGGDTPYVEIGKCSEI